MYRIFIYNIRDINYPDKEEAMKSDFKKTMEEIKKEIKPVEKPKKVKK